MRQIKIKLLPGIGTGDAKWEVVSFDAFLTEYSPSLALYISSTKQFPPLHILNEELRSGGADLGMSGGCFWKPFELSDPEYYEIREELLTSPLHELEYDSSLEDRTTLKKWCGAVISNHNPRNREPI